MKIKILVAAAVIATLALAGCSSSSKSSSSTTTTTTTTSTTTTSSSSSNSSTSIASGKASVCAARANLDQSVTALASPSLLTGGKSAIQSALDTVKTNLDAVASSAQATYKPQVDAVKSALDELQTTVSNFGSGSTVQNLQAAGSAIAEGREHREHLGRDARKPCARRAEKVRTTEARAANASL